MDIAHFSLKKYSNQKKHTPQIFFKHIGSFLRVTFVFAFWLIVFNIRETQFRFEIGLYVFHFKIGLQSELKTLIIRKTKTEIVKIP